MLTRSRIRTAVLLLLLATGAACGDERPSRSVADANPQDTSATTRELGASLAGAGAPRGEAYSYRGLYAGLTQGQLERILGSSPADSVRCHPEVKPVGEMSCTYHPRLGPDSAHVDVDVTYSAATDTSRVARTITVTRALPLDADGVAVAAGLADAFERQTTFLDKRDATYGEHVAQVRMGSVNAARLNYVDVNVSPLHGREVLVVKMSRTGAPKAAPTAAPAPIAPKSRKAAPKAPKH